MRRTRILVLLTLLGLMAFNAAGEEVAGGIPDTPAGKMFNEFPQNYEFMLQRSFLLIPQREYFMSLFGNQYSMFPLGG